MSEISEELKNGDIKTCKRTGNKWIWENGAYFLYDSFRLSITKDNCMGMLQQVIKEDSKTLMNMIQISKDYSE